MSRLGLAIGDVSDRVVVACARYTVVAILTAGFAAWVLGAYADAIACAARGTS